MLDNNETRAALYTLTALWPEPARQTLTDIARSASNAVTVVPWEHGPVANFSSVANLLMHWNNAILLPPECDVSQSTVAVWQAPGASTAVGTLAQRPAGRIGDGRTMADLFALLLPALFFVHMLRA